MGVNMRKGVRFYILWFILPAALLYTVFLALPLLDSLRLSFFTVNDSRQMVFSGFDNYKTLLTEGKWLEQFLRALANSFKFFAINMLLQNPVALLLAALLATKIRGGHIYRTILYIPVTLSLVVVAFIWQMLLNPSWGIIRDIMDIFGLGAFYKPWLGIEGSAINVMALLSGWQNLGVPIILYYASFIQIPDDLIEASRVDGSNAWRTFWTIKLPLVMPMVATISLMTYIFNFNAFDLIYAIKGPLAGPNFSTDTMMSFFFRTFYGHEFQQPNETMGATVATMILLILMIGVLIYILWNKKAKKDNF